MSDGEPEFEVIDLTMPIESLKTPVFPGYPQPLKTIFTLKSRHGYNSNVWTFVEHTATHVDSPNHFFDEAPTIDKMPVETFIGWATVLDFSSVPPRHVITVEEIKRAIESLPFKVGKDWIILFYTGYSDKAGSEEWYDYPELSREACEYLASLGIKAIGVDAPSPDRDPFPAHHVFLPKGIVIYENLKNLDKLVGKKFLFIGLPLLMKEATATPVRAVALILK